MTARKTIDQLLDGREIRRFKQEERAVAKIDRQLAAADRLIGQLCREGKTVYYVVRSNGKIKESTNRFELVDFLERNRYI